MQCMQQCLARCYKLLYDNDYFSQEMIMNFYLFHCPCNLVGRFGWDLEWCPSGDLNFRHYRLLYAYLAIYCASDLRVNDLDKCMIIYVNIKPVKQTRSCNAKPSRTTGNHSNRQFLFNCERSAGFCVERKEAPCLQIYRLDLEAVVISCVFIHTFI